ncbi:hypothetical protein ACFQ08_30520, partial [Streptosporangium algeriense]
TVGLVGERLAEPRAMADSAARVRVFSDDGRCVSDAVLMRRALEYVKAFDGVVAQHAQEPRLTKDAQMNEGAVSGRLGLTGWPAVAEEAIIARDCLLAAHVGSRLHVCHLSTAGSVEIVRWAKSKGWDITAEVTPHHLLLTDDLVEDSPVGSYNPIYKVNPPLRTRADVEALRAALADGTIDCVATDHAPHPVEDKETEWAAAAMGMIGLETALSVVQEAMVETGLLDWAGVAERMSFAPARIGRVAEHGRPIEAGAPANVTLYDPAVRAEVDPAGYASKSRNTPYQGRSLPGRVVECVGMQAAFDTALDVFRPAGSVGFVGVPHGVSHLAPMRLFGRQVRLAGGVAPARHYLPGLIDDVAEGRLDPAPLIDRVLRIDDVAEGYAAMDDGTALKAVIRMT